MTMNARLIFDIATISICWVVLYIMIQPNTSFDSLAYDNYHDLRNQIIKSQNMGVENFLMSCELLGGVLTEETTPSADWVTVVSTCSTHNSSYKISYMRVMER